ncbi:MAG: GNAT family N-acetyltransferase [Candidatus Thermoplasmatota archaeon]|nr:GNAT family N-acetyltransferase [Candidatus Thermoplasmatota archaeon]
MEIVNFDEVEDSDMIELNLACFNHTYSKDHIKKMIRSDKRMPDWGGELYAKEKGKILGCVGILFPRVKLSEETKKVGGIRNVCSRPSKSRRGVVKNLMERAHDTLRQEVELSFLMTPKSNVAYNLYKKLGYETVHVPPKAYKKAEEKETDIEFRDENDPEYVRSLYLESVKDLSGLVVREEDYWDMAEARGWPDNDNVKIAYRNGEKIGYSIYEFSRNSLSVKEFASEGNSKVLLQGLESICDKEYIVLSYVNPNYRDFLLNAGYSWHQDLWYSIMVKDLKNGVSDTMNIEDINNFHAGIYETF